MCSRLPTGSNVERGTCQGRSGSHLDGAGGRIASGGPPRDVSCWSTLPPGRLLHEGCVAQCCTGVDHPEHGQPLFRWNEHVKPTPNGPAHRNIVNVCSLLMSMTAAALDAESDTTGQCFPLVRPSFRSNQLRPSVTARQTQGGHNSSATGRLTPWRCCTGHSLRAAMRVVVIFSSRETGVGTHAGVGRETRC